MFDSLNSRDTFFILHVQYFFLFFVELKFGFVFLVQLLPIFLVSCSFHVHFMDLLFF
jgi:hypothetical protein